MNQPFYDLTTLDNAQTFNFESIGKEKIKKKILYQSTSGENFYNLALVDILEDGSYDDTVESNNGDMEKVLATVVKSFIYFFEQNPEAIVLFKGSTESRTRLYQIVINKELDNIISRFTILGINGMKFEPFRKNKSYDGFAIALKKH
ncbi:hypothetical protein VB796_09355 [Arcicella sp. LKC2W]|uniref:DUF6934 family protein n=1 Tax=Arcicella sp. LKC2W TaxID=2984198 RepID=UPI002B20D2F1|nr:hypothetical protein [Arcicella sp. LKC2W]MEA5459243.1 hypothetical protein [Arcicella sp. LKC2W]